jgi:maleylpyruvate isomerase
MKLHGYWRSSSSHRIRIALHWKGIAFEYAAVNLVLGEQRGAGHRARSPTTKVPVLELDDGRCIGESMAILAYLDELEPAPPLLPADPYRRARARMLAEMVNSGIQPYQNLEVLVHVKEVLHGDEKAWAHHFLARGVAALEEAAAPTAGRFLVGDAPTLADVYLVPQLLAARRFKVDLEPVPTLRRVEAACLELEAFQRARPEAQPDAPRPA